MSSDDGTSESDTSSALRRAFKAVEESTLPPIIPEIFDPQEELARLFAWIPPPLKAKEPQSSTRADISYMPSVESFYDRHIHAKRYLKRVSKHPTLLDTLETLVDACLESNQRKGVALPPVDDRLSAFVTNFGRDNLGDYMPGLSATSGIDVQQRYCRRIATCCSPVASALALDGPFPHWFRLFVWDSMRIGPNPWHVAEDMQFKLDLSFLSVSRGASTVSSRSDDAIRAYIAGTELEQSLIQVSERFPLLLTFQFLPPFPEAEELIKEMDNLFALDSFGWRMCQTEVYATPDEHLPPISVDADSTLLLDSGSLTPTTRQFTPKLVGSGNKTKAAIKEGNVIPPPRKVERPPQSHARMAACKQLIQRAWSESVDRDTTFVVFNSGNYERIGVRERSTQTLHLSEVYHVPTYKTHSYIKLHIGLYLATLKDAMDRAEQLVSIEDASKDRSRKKPKRPTNSKSLSTPKSRVVKTTKALGRPARKKRRAPIVERSMLTRGSDKELRNQCNVGRRNLALLTLHYKNHHSPAPLSLFRVGKSLMDADITDAAPRASRRRQYKPTEYFTLSLDEILGIGATGIAHPASLAATLEDGTSYTHQTIVKLAFTDEQQAKLRHEYEVYSHLAQAGVKHILNIWGLFESTSESVAVMVMEHGGASLRRLKSENDMPSFADCEPFLDAIEEINAAGVTHGDLRPENLLLDKRGRATIIDYDLATLNPDGPAPSERSWLRSVLKSYFSDRFA